MSKTAIIIAFSVMLTILSISFIYVGRRLFRWLHLVAPSNHTHIFIGICVFFALSIALAFLPLDVGVKKHLVWFAWVLIGIFVYLLLYFLLSDFVLIFTPKSHKFIVAAGWIVLALVAATAIYGIYNGRQIKQVSYAIKIDKEIPKLNIALIADLHLWYVNDEKWLAKIVENINALEPDIVVMAGDIFNDNFKALSKPDEAVRSLQSIKSKYGVYACLGNHDGGSTYGEMVSFLEQGNVKLLQDEYLVIEDKFVIVGRTDSRPIGIQGAPRKELSLVLEGVDMNMPIIVMDHSPANIKEYGSEIDLVLAGHTHGGQMFPFNIITNLANGMNYGHYKKDANSPNVIVTSGVGVWGPPFRIGTNNEVASVFTTRIP